MKVVIIGGVAAGMSAASKLKRTLGDTVDIDVFEKGREVSYAACGLPYFVAGHIADPDALVQRTVEEFGSQGIRVHLEHEATAVDTTARTVTVRDVTTGETTTHSYDKLIVGSGASPRRIPPLDEEWNNLFVVRTVQDAVNIRRCMEDAAVRHVVIVGAGYIGLEMAEACCRQGKQVTVVEFADRVLQVMDPEVTDIISRELVQHGIVVRTDAKVTELHGKDGRIRSAVMEKSGERHDLPADLVLNCAGIVPNTHFIDVHKAKNGAIIVNQRMETSAPDVYAAGDCSMMTSFITNEHMYAPLGTNANKQGKMIAELIAGHPVAGLKLLGSSCLRVFDTDAAKVGLSEQDAARLNLDYRANTITGASHASYYSPDTVLVKVVYEAATRRILGAQLAGKGVVAHRANYYAVAITAGMTVDEFAYVDMGYAPPFSGVWDVTLTAAGTAR